MTLTAGHQDFHSLVLSCNKDGMEALRKDQTKAAFEQFKYAEAILIANQAEGEGTSLLAVTCNNLGCYYKKVGKLHGALSYLRRALKMEVDLNIDEVTLAGTHLNICAILSKLEKHDKAVQHALCALDLINKRVSSTEPDKVSQDDYSVLAITYHNVAVERDFLQQYDKAAAAFQQGYQVATRCLGEDHPLSITLGKNCDAVLLKSQKLSKSAPVGLSQHRHFTKDASLFRLGSIQPGGKSGEVPSLPAVPGATLAANEASSIAMPLRSVRQDAAGWVGSEGTLATREIQGRDFAVPAIKDVEATKSAPSRFAMRKAPPPQALTDHPEALMDIIDADCTGHAVNIARTAPNDYRPNRLIKGTTRTSRVVRRTGLINSTRHRDEVIFPSTQSASSLQKTAYTRKLAAEKIQRVWRSWHAYCTENAGELKAQWICATMIQAHWRSYHVRRAKLDASAMLIQSLIRGRLVRKTLRKHAAAVTIQRHAIGMITRKQLRRLHHAAVKLQRLVRCGQARKRVREKRAFLTRTAITIQCSFRSMNAKRRVRELRKARNLHKAREKAATDIQRIHRSRLGRKSFQKVQEQYLDHLQRAQAATALQATARRIAATKKVEDLRAKKLEDMNKAATLLRKMWLGARSRKKYNEMLTEFARHQRYIICIQRYARGFLVRLRMWREAIRAEEELWGALEIQRVWRGYLGRVRFEHKYEEVWRREMSAVMISRFIRGWLARTRVNRTRRRIARAEFERARQRFRSAQRLQALARGVLTRKVTRAQHQRATRAAVCIQRIWRGHALRARLWKQVIELRATMIQAFVRGYIVRNRRFSLVAKVIFLQRAFRKWMRKPQHVKEKARADMQERKKSAVQIQGKFRKHRESQAIHQISATDA